MVNFSVTPADHILIVKIVDRAIKLYARAGVRIDQTSTEMDLTACHANGMPLDLPRLLEADDFNFAHDITGIANHINRRTGKIERCFMPRFHA